MLIIVRIGLEPPRLTVTITSEQSTFYRESTSQRLFTTILSSNPMSRHGKSLGDSRLTDVNDSLAMSSVQVGNDCPNVK